MPRWETAAAHPHRGERRAAPPGRRFVPPRQRVSLTPPRAASRRAEAHAAARRAGTTSSARRHAVGGHTAPAFEAAVRSALLESMPQHAPALAGAVRSPTTPEATATLVYCQVSVACIPKTNVRRSRALRLSFEKRTPASSRDAADVPARFPVAHVRLRDAARLAVPRQDAPSASALLAGFEASRAPCWSTSRARDHPRRSTQTVLDGLQRRVAGTPVDSVHRLQASV